jgi:hypothetical protein
MHRPARMRRRGVEERVELRGRVVALGAAMRLHIGRGGEALVEDLVGDPGGLRRGEAVRQQQDGGAFERGAADAIGGVG